MLIDSLMFFFLHNVCIKMALARFCLAMTYITADPTTRQLTNNTASQLPLPLSQLPLPLPQLPLPLSQLPQLPLPPRLSSDLDELESALLRLRSNLQTIHAHATATASATATAGATATASATASATVGRQLALAVSEVPLVDPAEFEAALQTGTQDLLMAVYVPTEKKRKKRKKTTTPLYACG
jgi:hypothetical protein